MIPPHTADGTAYELVAGQAGLDRLSARLANAPEVAIDTEADNQWHYRTLLCLLQIEVDGEIFLVDPLAQLELGGLFDALRRPRLVMHGSDFDLRILRERAQFRPASLFDTMLAAQLAGLPRIGLASLLEHYFGVKVSKENQKANWSRRPLTTELLDYAAMDARLLRPLRDRLQAELEVRGRMEWLRQRCEWQIQQATSGFERDEEQAWRVGGSERLRGRALAVLFDLWHWREREAERIDWPPFKILQAAQLLELCRLALEGQEGALVDRILSTKGGRRFRGLREAITAGLQRDPASLPRRGRNGEDRPAPLTTEEQTLLERIRVRRDALAQELGLDPTLIASRSQLGQVVRSPERLDAFVLPWQANLLRPLIC